MSQPTLLNLIIIRYHKTNSFLLKVVSLARYVCCIIMECKEFNNNVNIISLFRMKYWEHCYKESDILLHVLRYTVLLFSVKILAFVKCDPTYQGHDIFFTTPWCVQNSFGAHQSSSPLSMRWPWLSAIPPFAHTFSGFVHN
jgi:hypothetical protein